MFSFGLMPLPYYLLTYDVLNFLLASLHLYNEPLLLVLLVPTALH